MVLKQPGLILGLGCQVTPFCLLCGHVSGNIYTDLFESVKIVCSSIMTIMYGVLEQARDALRKAPLEVVHALEQRIVQELMLPRPQPQQQQPYGDMSTPASGTRKWLALLEYALHISASISTEGYRLFL